jgi:protein SCO1
LSHANAQLVVNHGEIPGFMGAMTLGYAVRDRRALAGLSPGDEITADVVVQGDHSWLENIVVVKKASSPPQTPEVVQPPAKRNLR